MTRQSTWIVLILHALLILSYNTPLVSCTVIDLITGESRITPWLEIGKAVIDDLSWATIETELSDFNEAVIFISIPEIANTDGNPFVPRIQTLSSSGHAKYKAKLIQANDSYCSREWYVPKPLLFPSDVSWMVAELGAFRVDDNDFFVSTGHISRQYVDPAPSLVRLDYIKGCTTSNSSCRFRTDSVGVAVQLQTMVYERILTVRLAAAYKTFANVLLQPHDSADTMYTVMPQPEVLAMMTYDLGGPIYCERGLRLEMYRYWVGVNATAMFTSLRYLNHFSVLPGVYGTIGTLGTADFTTLYASSQSRRGAQLSAKEDQCLDEETIHTNAEEVFVLVLGETYYNISLEVECGVFSSAPRTDWPTTNPTYNPTILPSRRPTSTPTQSLTSAPTHSPTLHSTVAPTCAPTPVPSELPTCIPTAIPSLWPTAAPTTSPSVEPTLKPSLTPSVTPTTIPTLYPTFISPLQPSYSPTSSSSHTPTMKQSYLNSTKLFDTFDSSILLEDMSLDVLDFNIHFSYAANSPTDLSDIKLRWEKFVWNYIRSPFELKYTSLVMRAMWLEQGELGVMEAHAMCTDYRVSASIISALLSTEKSASSVTETCGGTTFTVSSGIICSGCNSSQPYCPRIERGEVGLPLADDCFRSPDTMISKHAVFFGLSFAQVSASTVPGISSLSVQAQRTTMVVTATIDPTPTGGALYCKAFLQGSAMPTVSLVKFQGGVSHFTKSTDLSLVKVNLSNLIAASVYDVYCLTVDSIGNAMSAVEMMSTIQTSSTLCCREIAFVSSPQTVHTTIYKRNVFTYRLPAHPVSVLTVVPVVMDVKGVVMSDVAVVPSSHTFSIGNRHLGLTRSFVLKPSDIGQARSVHLQVYGDDSNVYNHSVVLDFTTVNSTSVLPAPYLRSARFSNSGGNVVICFSGPTDFGLGEMEYDNLSPWVCGDLLSFSGDMHTSCTWLNSTCLSMAFCKDSLCSNVTDRSTIDLIEPGDFVQVRGGLIRTACDPLFSSICTTYPTAKEEAIVVSPPRIPLRPSIQLVTSEVGGFCSLDLVVDASGSFGNGGRDWKFIGWDVIALHESNTSVGSVKSWLNSFDDISSPIIVPLNMFESGTYTFSLSLSNFLAVGASEVVLKTIDVTVGNVATLSLPVSFDGPGERHVKSFDEFKASVSYKIPPCISVNMTYIEWQVYHGTQYMPVIVSTSATPYIFRLAPYTLKAGKDYTLLAKVYLHSGRLLGAATLAVSVAVSSVHLSIKGGSTQVIAANSEVVLDASESVIEDVSPAEPTTAWAPNITWSCTFTGYSFGSATFGDDCTYIFGLNVSNPISSLRPVPIRTVLMDVHSDYTFTASTVSGSGTTVSESVLIRVADCGRDIAASVSLQSTFKKFNVNHILRLSGLITPPVNIDEGSYALNATWTVQDGMGKVVDTDGLLNTPSTISLGVNSPSVYAFSAKPSSFIADRYYIFTLSAIMSADTVSAITYVEITLMGNAPPESGTLVLSPHEGMSFQTKFVLKALYWVDDIEDYPLSYGFAFSKTPYDRSFALGLHSHMTYVETVLPAGLESLMSQLWCSVTVSDFYEASTSSSTVVTVRNTPVGDTLYEELEADLTYALATLDVDLIAQTINSVVLSFASSECSSAPNCASLNRHECSSTAHTCGSCFDGYIGVVEDANIACVENDSNLGEIGDSCGSHNECIHGYCDSGLCRHGPKECPTSILGATCSGHGTCEPYSIISGELLVECSYGDGYCSSRCVCDTDFFGTVCNMTSEEYRSRTETRELMCSTMQHFYNLVDHSYQLANIMTATTVEMYHPLEITSTSGISKCLDVLLSLINISDAGYLRNDDLLVVGANISPHVLYADIIGKFTESLVYLRDLRYSGEDIQSLIVELEASVYRATSSLGNSINNDMVPGESSVELISSGLRMSIRYDAVDSLNGALLRPPSTIAARSHGDLVSSIVLPSTGMQVCKPTIGNGYMRFSVVEWDSVPYASVNFTENGTTATLGSRILRFSSMMSTAQEESQFIGNSSGSDTYTLTMQYANAQDWSIHSPSCAIASDGLMEACPCVAVSHTPYNVTYECNNLLSLCPPIQSASRRKLVELQHWGDRRHPHYTFHVSMQRRLDFDYAGEADDGSEDGSIVEYLALVTSIGTTSVNTLSNEPQNIDDIKAAMPVIIMMTALVCTLFVGLIILHRWDIYDFNYVRYVIRCLPRRKYKRPYEARAFDIRNAFIEKGFVADKEKSAINDLQMFRVTHPVIPSALSPNDAVSLSASADQSITDRSAFNFEFFSDPLQFDSQDVFDDKADESLTKTRENVSIEGSLPLEDTSYKSYINFDNNSKSIDKIGHKIATFFDQALPPTSLLNEKSGWLRFIKAIFREHHWVRMYTYASIRLPRTIRLMVLYSNVLILLFADTLFYGILFPDNGHCEEYSGTTSVRCLKEPSKFQSGESLCDWDVETEECSVRPPPTTIQFYAIVAVFVTCFSVLPEVFCGYLLEEVCSKKPVFNTSQTDNYDQFSTSSDVRDDNIFSNSGVLNTVVSKYAYFDFMELSEEANALIKSVRNCLHEEIGTSPVPWRVSRWKESQIANAKALMDSLGVYPDGTPVPLTLRQKLFFGSSRKRVEWKLRKVRTQSKIILDEIESFTYATEDCKDTTLIQHFILEQLTPFKRYALKREFFQFDYAEPETVSGFVWLSTWMFLISVWMFLVYWIFQWAMLNNGSTLNGWMAAIFFVLLQDIFINDVMQVFVVHVIVIEAMRPQLRKIYSTLNSIMADKAFESESALTESINRVRVVQHLSAACRAARHPKVSHLPSARLLMRVSDYDVAMCRDERGVKIGWFTMALLAIPTALALSHESVQESFLDVVFPTLWSCFVIANAYLYDVSPFALAVPYSVLFLHLFYRHMWLVPRHRTQQKQDSLYGGSIMNPVYIRDTECTSSISMSSSFKHSPGAQARQWQNMNKPLQCRASTLDSLTKPEATQDDSCSVVSEISCEISYRSCGAGIKSSTGADSIYLSDNNTSHPCSTLPSEILRLQKIKKIEKFQHREKGTNGVTKLMNKYVWNAARVDNLEFEIPEQCSNPELEINLCDTCYDECSFELEKLEELSKDSSV